MLPLISKDQFKAVVIIQASLIGAIYLVYSGFWNWLCGSTVSQCLTNEPHALVLFLLIGLWRPLTLTPTFVVAYLAGSTFDPLEATILTAFTASCSSFLVYFIGHQLGLRAVRPWLSGNMPATWEILKQNQFRMMLLLRWITILPFDLVSLMIGVAGFRLPQVFLATFLGVLPESYMFVSLASNPDQGSLLHTFGLVVLFGFAAFIPFLIFEFLFRKRGSSLWSFARRAYYEVIYEIRINNEIIKKRDYDPKKTPVILMYGFFSSRKALAIMERLLTKRGFQVMTFNLGGVLGVFFTRGIKETAHYVDEKIRRQMLRHGFSKVHVVGHSKGGLVALWWLLKLGGHKYCDRVITMGTPYKGSYLTYLALASPLGFIWRDLWQMRPGSQLLQDLKTAEIPENIEVFTIFSRKDRVAGLGGDFQHQGKRDNLISVPMHHVAHFEFLYRKDVADAVASLLRQGRWQGIVPTKEPITVEVEHHNHPLVQSD